MESLRNRHLTYFRVDNFKCFPSIELNDIGLINLVVGDNNIGKSSLLEALLVDHDLRVFNLDLKAVLFDRGLVYKDKDGSPRPVENSFKLFIRDYPNNNEVKFRFKTIGFRDTDLFNNIAVYNGQLPQELENPLISKLYCIDDTVVVSEANYNFDTTDNDVPAYLSDQTLYEDIVDFYENTIQTDFSLKTRFIGYLRDFVPNAVNIEVRTAKDDFQYPQLVVFTEGSTLPIPLNQYGQGTVKMLKIVMAIIAFRGYRLMLDEVDNGIHFSRLKKYFSRILTLAKENNTQLFISTHSAECLKYIKETLEESDLKGMQNEVRLFSLNRDKNEIIKAYRYDYTEMISTLGSDIDVRGGK